MAHSIQTVKERPQDSFASRSVTQSMNLTPAQKTLIERVVNALATKSADGDYGAIIVRSDGPHGIRQLTYGRSLTTEYGKLRHLIVRYAAAGGLYSHDLGRYARRIGTEPLVDDKQFRSLLRTAGRTDPVMRRVQDLFFDEEYFLPAVQWCTDHGLVLPLSALVVYDSFIHSGGVLPLIRRSVMKCVPAEGGIEIDWTTAYVKARHRWLIDHRRADVRRTSYRTRCLSRQIAQGNWQLHPPIRANGVTVE